MTGALNQLREEYVKQLNETQQVLNHLVNQVEQGKRAIDRLQGAISALDVLDAKAKEAPEAKTDKKEANQGDDDGEAVEKGA